MVKEKEKKTTITEKKITLEDYEKIGNLAYKLDRISGRLFASSIIVIVLLVYTIFMAFYGEPRSPKDIEFYQNILPTLIIILLFSLGGLLVGSVIFQWVGYGYKYYKKYDKNEIIRLYLYELSNNLDTSRKWEILKHLTYNLVRLRGGSKSDFIYLGHFHWKIYYRIGRKEFKFQYNVIDKIISFIEDAVIFLDLNQYKTILPEIGDCIKKNDFRGIAKIFMNNKELFDKINEIKTETKMIRLKEGFKKAKNRIEWVSVHGRNLIYIIIFIIILFLLLTGKIQISPFSFT